MRLSRTPNLIDVPSPWHPSWAEFVAFCSSPVRVPDKKAAPLWCPASWEPGATRKTKSAVVDVGAIVLDFDDVPAACVGAVALALHGVSAVLHSSFGAAALYPHRTKFRAVIEIAQAIPRSRWDQIWSRVESWIRSASPELAALTSAQLDRKCRDPGHCFFVPSAPLDAPPGSVWVHVSEGVPLDVDALPDATEAPQRAFATRPAQREDLERLARQWSKRRKPRAARLGACLQQLLAGNVYAYPGERDQITFELASDLSRDLEDCTAESIASFFGPSLAQMGEDAPTAEGVAEKIERARARTDVPQIVPQVARPHVLVSSEGGAFYYRGAEDWHGPYQGPATAKAAREILAHAHESGAIDLYEQTEKGPRERTPLELLQRYGATIERHEIVLGARESTFHDGAFLEGRARLREIDPSTEGDAAAYVRALAGDDKTFHDLMLWLGMAPRITEPIAALTFIGARGVGKSLFAESLARLWTDGPPTSAKEILGSYNAGILRCPLVWADEKIPTDHRGKPQTEELRALVSAYGHAIERKYLPTVHARGCLRIVVTINDDSQLGFRGELTPSDVAAIAERLYVVRPDAERMRQFYAERPGFADYLKRGDGLARLALAIERQLPQRFERRHRFLISSGAAHADAIAERSGKTPEVLAWIVGWLSQPGRVADALSRVTSSREIHVAVDDMIRTWDLFVPESARPSRPALISALRGIAEKTRESTGPRLWNVRRWPIERWIEESSSVAWDLEKLIDTRISAR